ncbi:hypothetical protein QQ045_019800 [Rhodiola kirilowii]
MARDWGGEHASSKFEEGFAIFWAAMFSISIILAAVFSCADGAGRDKASHGDHYGTSCAGGCGAGCGA